MKKKLPLIAVAVVVVAAAAFWLLSRGADKAAVAEAPPPPVEGEVIEVAEMTANLSGPQLHYARVGVAVVTRQGADTTLVEAKFPLLKDAVLDEVSAFTPEALRAPDGGDQLRARLSERAVTLYPDGEVLRVVLTALLIQ